MTDLSDENTTSPRSNVARVAFAAFLAVGAAAGLFAAGAIYGHHDKMDGHMSADMGMMAGDERPGRTRGERGMMRGGMGMAGTGMMVVESEREFLREMIPHHQEAIASAKLLKRGTERAEMREFADEIIAAQEPEVESMTEWLDEWHDGAKPADDDRPTMRSDLDELRGDELDRAFLDDMVMHHMMAVQMSRSLLARDLAIHDEVEELARSIVTTQTDEIRKMLDWSREFGGGRDGGMMPGMR